MDAGTGVLSGTPSAADGTEILVRVVDWERPTPAAFAAVLLLSIAIAPPLSLTISPAGLPSATKSLAYHTVLEASGGVQPYLWSITSGALPSGLSLAPSSGMITGMPTTTGTSALTVAVSDSESTPQTQTLANLSITVSAPHNSLLKGTYAFLVSGYIAVAAPQAPVAWAGSLVADGNGNVSGVIDSAGPFLPLSDTPLQGHMSLGTIGEAP